MSFELLNTLDTSKVLPKGISKEFPQGTTLESLYQINNQSIWFLIWILKKNRFWLDLIKEVLETPFTVKREYRPNGQIHYLVIQKNNKNHGIQRDWYSNGYLFWEKHWKDGKPDGFERGWYENKQLGSEKHWKDGKEDGIQRIWNVVGKLHSEHHCKNSQIYEKFAFSKKK